MADMKNAFFAWKYPNTRFGTLEGKYKKAFFDLLICMIYQKIYMQTHFNEEIKIIANLRGKKTIKIVNF